MHPAFMDEKSAWGKRRRILEKFSVKQEEWIFCSLRVDKSMNLNTNQLVFTKI